VCNGSAGNSDTLIADLCICGAWQPQTEALFNIRVIDTDARSYSACTPLVVLCSAEAEKKHNYSQACHDRRATFTPLCVSVDGVLGPETEFFVKRLSDFLAAKWKSPYGVAMGWVWACFSFAILRATLLCLRGSCTKWKSLGIINGASLPLLSFD